MRLTRDEIILITSVLLVLVLGQAVRHYRDLSRNTVPMKQPASVKTRPQ